MRRYKEAVRKELVKAKQRVLMLERIYWGYKQYLVEIEYHRDDDCTQLHEWNITPEQVITDKMFYANVHKITLVEETPTLVVSTGEIIRTILKNPQVVFPLESET